MKVIDPGHAYDLDVLDGRSENTKERLTFVKREGANYPGNLGHYPGTNMQEVLRALIDRTNYVNNQIKHGANYLVLAGLRAAIYHLEWRAAERHGRLSAFHKLIKESTGENLDGIEKLPTCAKCGHIGCEGSCHK